MCMTLCNHNISHLVDALMWCSLSAVGVRHASLVVQLSYTHTRAHTSPYQTAHCGNCHDLMHCLSCIWLQVSPREPFSSRLCNVTSYEKSSLDQRSEESLKEWVADVWSWPVRYRTLYSMKTVGRSKISISPSLFSHSQWLGRRSYRKNVTEYSASVAGHCFDLSLMWVASIHSYNSLQFESDRAQNLPLK